MTTTSTESKIEDAIRLTVHHFPTADKLIKPTVFHSIRVGMYLYDRNHDWETCVAAILHDTLEDTKITKKEIEQKFGKRVLELVEANTQNYDLPKDQQKEDLIKRCATHSEAALIIKCADVIDNFNYRTKRGEIQELERCFILADLIRKHTSASYKDPIFKELPRRPNI